MAIYAGLSPFSMKPASFADSFNGMGTGFGLMVAPFSSWQHGIEASYLSHTDSNVTTLVYRYYIQGAPQYTPLRSTQDVHLKHSGIFLGAGLAYYNLTKEEELAEGSTAEPASQSVTGIGAVVGIGWEKPFWGKVFVSPRVDFLTSGIGGVGFQGVYVRILFGIPLTFY